MSRILILSATVVPCFSGSRARSPFSFGRSAAAYSPSSFLLRMPRSAATRGRASLRPETEPVLPRLVAPFPASHPGVRPPPVHPLCFVPSTSSCSCPELLPGETPTEGSGRVLGGEWGSARGPGRPRAERSHHPEERPPAYGEAAPERRARARDPNHQAMISVTTPEPTVRPPSRIANRSCGSIAIGVISSTSIATLSPGITISTPSGRCAAPVTSVVRK